MKINLKMGPNRLRIKIAGVVVEVEATYKWFPSLCKRFLTEEDPVLHIRVDQEEIEYERQQCKVLYAKECVSEGQLESSAIQRKLTENLIEKDILLIHGAAINTDGNGYLFLGKSGVGKSTHIFKWIMNAPNVFVINGDKPFIIFDSEPYICGSPWAGKERMNSNMCVPLKAVAYLERGEENYIEEVSFSGFFLSIYQQIYKPADAEKMKKTLRLIQSLDGKVHFYRFKCNNFKEDCFQVSYEALTGNKL